MNAEQIAVVLADAVGNPTTGVVRDCIPAMAEAVAQALNPDQGKGKPTKDTRVLEADETR